MPKTFHELCEEIKSNVTECTVEEVKEMFNQKEDFILIDIREESEFQKGNIKNSVHIGKGILERDIHLFVNDHNKKIVLYCGGGYRTILSADNLQKMGYTNVYSMIGGWKMWNASGGEINGEF